MHPTKQQQGLCQKSGSMSVGILQKNISLLSEVRLSRIKCVLTGQRGQQGWGEHSAADSIPAALTEGCVSGRSCYRLAVPGYSQGITPKGQCGCCGMLKAAAGGQGVSSTDMLSLWKLPTN